MTRPSGSRWQGAPIITLLTDFGMEDIYVGVMKGVIATLAPGLQVIDLTHGISRQDILQGGLRWAAAVPFFPPGTIHVAVVDPGVGGKRRILAVRARGFIFVAPDNGILGLVVSQQEVEEAVSVERLDELLPAPSRTFHGRDILAPVASWLARGMKLARLGPPVTSFKRLALPPVQEVRTVSGRKLVGQVVDVDGFGNCTTNISGNISGTPAGGLRNIQVGKWRFASLADSYGEVEPGKPLAIVGSAGLLEIAVNQGRADRVLGLHRGQRVTATVGPARRRRRRKQK